MAWMSGWKVRPTGVALLVVGCAVVLCLLDARGAEAANLQVTNENDSGGGSLRDVINQANGNGQADTITFADNVRTVAITSDEFVVSDSQGLTIDGGGDVTVSGRGSHRVFTVITNARMTLRGITVDDGAVLFGNVPPGTNSGGGISSNGNVTLQNSTVTNSSGGIGAGIFNNGSGTLTVNDSTISGNEGEQGAGIYNNTGVVTINDSTISNNTSSNIGGGIYNAFGTATINGSTIAGNSAVSGGGVYGNISTTTINNSTIAANRVTSSGGGVYHTSTSSGVLTVSSSIIAANSREDVYSNVGSGLRSGGYNVIGIASGPASSLFNQTGDVAGVSGQQAFGKSSPALANNGGSTQTVATAPGSSAINRIPASVSGQPQTDQRGVERPQFANSDSGAYEYDGAAPTITVNPEQLPDARTGTSYRQQLSARGSNAAYTFEVTEGNLPAGISLRSNGLLNGTPPQNASTQTFTVTATDGSGFIGSRRFTLKVAASTADAKTCTIKGTPGDDVLRGTPKRDVICGFAGDDLIHGYGGNDLIIGGADNDLLYGGDGLDTHVGGAGDDTLVGGKGKDRLNGGSGDNSLIQ